MLVSHSLYAMDVVVHASVSEHTISRQKLRLIFSQRLSHWADGQPIKVIVFSPTLNEHIEFCEQRLGLLPFQLQRIWDRDIYSGRSSAPIQVESSLQMIKLLENTPGSIGYLPEHMDVQKRQGVKVINE